MTHEAHYRELPVTEVRHFLRVADDGVWLALLTQAKVLPIGGKITAHELDRIADARQLRPVDPLPTLDRATLRAARERLGTYAGIARACGISESHYAMLERGRHGITPRMAARLAPVLRAVLAEADE